MAENPLKNQYTADVFARYLKKRYGWDYDVVLPKAKNQPIFDAKLVSSGNGELFLQLKQILQGDAEFMRSQRGRPGMGNPGKDWKMFKNVPIVPLVKNSEEKYGKETRNLILILHVDDGYLMPSDGGLIDKNDFRMSSFKGIYLVSPKHELWKDGSKKIQNEFVSEIKSAF